MGEGSPFIILHGLFGSSDNWQTHAKRLADYFEVYLVDQRNHGHSDWSEDFNYELMADDLKELIDDEGLSEIYLLGHSMGGKPAMFFAQKYPVLLAKLIIVDMGIKSYPSHHGPILEGLNALNLDVIKSRGEATKEMAKYVENEATRMFLLKNLYWKDKGQLAWRINIPVLEEKMSEILVPLPQGECFVPTLFMRGGQSGYIVEEDYSKIRNAFPDCDIKTIERAGHWIHAEAPKEFMDEVLGYCLR